MNAQRVRQTVIGVLILVVLTMFWHREVPTSVDTTSVDTTGAPTSAASVPDVAPQSPSADTSAATTDQRPAAGSNAAFDYYVLVLSWSPTHCSSDAGRGRDDDLQCRGGRPYGFVLHGVWPQNERGYPQSCASDEPRTVSDAVMDKVLRISPSAQLVQHEWEKHGTCSGLNQEDYFAAVTRAVGSVKLPAAYNAPQRPIVTTPDDVRRAFLDENPSLSRDDVSATCSRNQLAEVWVCLDRSLHPRACSSEVRKRHCGGREVRMLAVRGDWPR